MNAMNHEQAMQTQAAERYLLGELDAPEREAYEEHLSTFSAAQYALKR